MNKTALTDPVSTTPDDLATLRALVQRQAELLRLKDQEIQNKDQEIQNKDQEIQNKEQEIQNKEQELESKERWVQRLQQANKAFALELSHLRRMRYGRKSEALPAEQQSLFAEDSHADEADLLARVDDLAAEAEAALAGESAPGRRRRRAGRQAFPAHLPRIDIRHEPATCTCGECGEALRLIREDVSEQLDIIPAQFRVLRHIRPQYACRSCERVVAEPAAPAVIDGGAATAAVLAWVVAGKYLDHLPLYRLEQIAARQEVPLPRSTLADWVGRIGLELMPLAERLALLLRNRRVLHADETPVQQLAPKAGKTKRAYLWVYRSGALDEGPPIVVFDYQAGRAGIHAKTFLTGWRGCLVVDDYSGYKALFGPEVTEVGCWAHARRKFYELHVANRSPMAAEALRRIGDLYAIEQEARGMTPEERLRVRQAESLPRLAALKAWLDEQALVMAPGTGAFKAIAYSLKRWSALSLYATRADLPLDNNAVENCIRPIALGKKNWLFAGSERAGQRAAAIQSLLGTAKLNGLDPQAWLKETLEKLPTWPNSRIDELLPLRSTPQDPSRSPEER
jgi:transposase